MASEPVFRLYACCVPVRGARRSTVCDLQRLRFHLIPNGLHEILTSHAGKRLAEIQAAYDHRCDREIEEYFAFLEGEELGFWCEDPDAFPPLDLTWERPELVTNAIIDVDEESRHDYAAILSQLHDLGCRALQLRAFCTLAGDKLAGILDAAAEGTLRSIELVLKHDPAWSEGELEALCMRHQRISTILVHSAPEPRLVRVEGILTLISWLTEPVTSHAHCGQVHPAYFTSNLAAFSEAQAHNSCLNRKISVDARGYIRNCPSMGRTFGHVSETSLHSALAAAGFRDLWLINKDQIEVCKDCEFRYICTDCRAFIRDPGDLYSKPSKCTYDPYTAAWA